MNCLHDPTTAQRDCACDPACVCRVAGNCITMSGDVMPAMFTDAAPGKTTTVTAAELLDGPTFVLDQEGFSLLGGPSLAQLSQKLEALASEAPASPLFEKQLDAAIEMVPPERLKAELARWQDELSDEEPQ